MLQTIFLVLVFLTHSFGAINEYERLEESREFFRKIEDKLISYYEGENSRHVQNRERRGHWIEGNL